MSLPQQTIDSYITRTLTAEQKAAAKAMDAEVRRQNRYERRLRRNLAAALERDDKKAAIRLAYALLEYDDDTEEIEKLYDFLLTRVGVPYREPFFITSTQPLVQMFSGVCVTVALFLLGAQAFNIGERLRADVLTCAVAGVIFGIPLLDVAFATVCNRLNRHRLTE